MALRIVHIASEVVPYSKTGGLADVVGALPHAQAALGHRVTIVAPAHRAVLHEQPPGAVKAKLNAMGISGELLLHRRRGVTVALIDCPLLFVRPGLYGLAGRDFPDNAIRFAFFARAALLAIGRMGGADVIHAHDWQAGLVPLLLRRDESSRFGLHGACSVLTIHNLAYQGLFDAWTMAACEIPDDAFHVSCLEYYGQVNLLKGGIMSADAITTVSPTYAREILTRELGCGLDGVLTDRRDSLHGILNGLDLTTWSPSRDPLLPRRFTAKSVLRGKRAARRVLAEEAKLLPGERPLAGMVARLTEQKGATLVATTMAEIVALGFDVAILGTGDASSEALLRTAIAAHPGRAVLLQRFDETLAHLIYSASDVFLMPSRFEPCGLGQMIAMRYGALPVVHATGGLADTVTDASEKDGVGFVFTSHTSRALVEAMGRASRVLADRQRHTAMQTRAMARDFSWQASARRYVELYENLLKAKR